MVTWLLHDTPKQYGWPRTQYWGPAGSSFISGVVGVHTTEGPTGLVGPDNSAENVLNFLRNRTDFGSYNIMSDWDSILPLIHPGYAAWADTTNNAHAMSVSGSLQANRWMELSKIRREQVVTNMGIAASIVVKTAVNDGFLQYPTPARRITPYQAITGSVPGFYGHGETNPGTRYDPGQHFNWALFLNVYSDEMFGTNKELFTVEQFDVLKALLERGNALSTENQRRIGKLEETVKGVPKAVLNYPIPEAHTGGTSSLLIKGQWEKTEHVKTQKKVDKVLDAVKGDNRPINPDQVNDGE